VTGLRVAFVVTSAIGVVGGATTLGLLRRHPDAEAASLARRGA
jgi:hypothetical protein